MTSTAGQEPEGADDPLLAASGLTKTYGNLTALDGVSVAIGTGEIVGLIGPNGAGKTTLFNCLSGVEAPTEGTVRLNGADVTGLPGHEIARRGLARTFQIARPLEELTVLENVMVGAHIHTKRRRRAREIAEDALGTIGLAHELDTPADELTIADQRSMELARALATDPAVLLIDEIMAGLTPAESDALLDVLGEVRAQGRSIFVIEHDMRAIMDVSDRVVVLNQGRVIAEDSPEAVADDQAVIDSYLG